jgi:hypothetical protein
VARHGFRETFETAKSLVGVSIRGFEFKGVVAGITLDRDFPSVIIG